MVSGCAGDNRFFVIFRHRLWHIQGLSATLDGYETTFICWDNPPNNNHWDSSSTVSRRVWAALVYWQPGGPGLGGTRHPNLIGAKREAQNLIWPIALIVGSGERGDSSR